MRSFLKTLCGFPILLVSLTASVESADNADPGYLPKEAIVVFNNGVEGKIELKQADWKAPLGMTMDLSGVKEAAGPWHIHRLPVISDCSANSTGGHYNPMNVSATYKACENPADCEAGDLATKFGALDGAVDKGVVKKSITDPQLSLYGFNSIIGRSIVIHEKDGKRYSCGTIKYKDTKLSFAKATFKDAINGVVLLSQPTENNAADTAILMDLKSPTNTTPAVSATFAIYDKKCGQDGAKVYNPDQSNVKCIVYENTSPFKPCVLGDLSGRHGNIKVPATGEKAVFINDYLPLTGENSIVGKSLVIEATDGSAKYCADIVSAEPSGPFDTGKRNFRKQRAA